jgi:hypothetical protein
VYLVEGMLLWLWGGHRERGFGFACRQVVLSGSG